MLLFPPTPETIAFILRIRSNQQSPSSVRLLDIIPRKLHFIYPAT